MLKVPWAFLLLCQHSSHYAVLTEIRLDSLNNLKVKVLKPLGPILGSNMLYLLQNGKEKKAVLNISLSLFLVIEAQLLLAHDSTYQEGYISQSFSQLDLAMWLNSSWWCAWGSIMCNFQEISFNERVHSSNLCIVWNTNVLFYLLVAILQSQINSLMRAMAK